MARSKEGLPDQVGPMTAEELDGILGAGQRRDRKEADNLQKQGGAKITPEGGANESTGVMETVVGGKVIRRVVDLQE